MSTDVASDFVDFFVFGGQGSKMGKALGVSDIILKFDAQTKGIGFKKKVTDQLKVGYEIEEQQERTGESEVNQKVEGEIDVTDQVSVGVSRKMTQSQSQSSAGVESPSRQTDPETNLLLKYKKRF